MIKDFGHVSGSFLSLLQKQRSIKSHSRMQVATPQGMRINY